ncbi:30S ribosomal protein S8 [bacterium]|nr:30S ribosomal protein S8 [bacterium]HPF35212.1 30S ribosomal protein S8 [Candidatus Krumholzibacteria bacterium]HRX51304.1 30S ribosomal protein S8 [Candidatus Krumholzibacteria bacterium]
MSMTDPVADMLTRIRNATIAGHRRVDIPASKTKRAVAKVLLEQGYVQNVQDVVEGPQGLVRITLKYFEREGKQLGVIEGIRRVSKPGRRMYANKDSIPKVRGGYGIAIVSTNQGIMTDHQCRRNGVGGEILCEIW